MKIAVLISVMMERRSIDCPIYIIMHLDYNRNISWYELIYDFYFLFLKAIKIEMGSDPTRPECTFDPR